MRAGWGVVGSGVYVYLDARELVQGEGGGRGVSVIARDALVRTANWSGHKPSFTISFMSRRLIELHGDFKYLILAISAMWSET